MRRLIEFMRDVKSGCATVTAPVYSHLHYDIVPDAVQTVTHPDILILEGLNVLQRGDRAGEAPRMFVSDYFDFSLYIDADETYIRQFFLERLSACAKPPSVTRPRSSIATRSCRWTRRLPSRPTSGRQINSVNLRENIAPTRERASLILRKGADHTVEQVLLRKL